MMSERGNSISIVNGVTIKKCDPQTVSTYITRSRGNNQHYNMNNECLYTDPFKKVKKEHNRILNYRSKPCPSDFPEKLKPYWKGHLEFSFTPYESGWKYLQQQKKLGKK